MAVSGTSALLGPFIFVGFIPYLFASLTYPISCSNGSSLDVSSLSCSACPVGTVTSPDGFGCVCAPNFVQIPTSAVGFTCQACPTDQVATQDQRACLPCAGENVTLTGGTCTCLPGHRLADFDANGTLLPAKTCLPCPAGYETAASDPYSCQPCPASNMTVVDGVCQCATDLVQIGGSCVTTAAATAQEISQDPSALTVVYNDVINSVGGSSTRQSVDSAVFHELYLPSATLCLAYRDRQSCQALGNLCVLQMYDKSSDVCDTFLKIEERRTGATNSYPDWRPSLPWLYYTALPTEITGAQDVGIKVAFRSDAGSDKTSQLTFLLAAYDLDGTFRGLEPLTNQLQLCETLSWPSVQYLNFGAQISYSCLFNLTRLLSLPPTTFYDLYLLDANNAMYPVPVRVMNYRLNGVLVNLNSFNLPAEQDNDQFTRRFFLYDNVSGRKQGTGAPEIIRFAESIQLKVQIRSDDPSSIYPPTINITYSERAVSLVTADDIAQRVPDPASGSTAPAPPTKVSLAFPQVTFESVYFMDETKYITAYNAILGVLGGLGFIYWIFRTRRWYVRNKQIEISRKLFGKMFVYACDIASDIFFWVPFLFSAYWFIFYKGQANVSVLLPISGLDKLPDEDRMVILIIVALVCKFIRLCDIMYVQTHADVFLIDWEKSRGKLQSKGNEQAGYAPVSVWRSLFVMNELNDMQTARAVSVEFSLGLMLLLLVGVNINGGAYWQPPLKDPGFGQQRWLLRFAILAFFYLALALVQIVVHYAFTFRYIRERVTQFVDLLSVSNISLIIWTEYCYGFYVHGRSVHSHADTSMTGLNANLKHEEDNVTGSRGLLPNTTDQVFEMYASEQLRRVYEELYRTIVKSDDMRNEKIAYRFLKREKRKVPQEQSIRAYATLSKFFTNFVDKILPEFSYEVVERGPVRAALRMAPEKMDTSPGTTYLVADKNNRIWSHILLWGVEYDLLILETLIFACTDLIWQSTAIDIFVTGAAVYIVRYFRRVFGRNNLSKKTLIDERFLLS